MSNLLIMKKLIVAITLICAVSACGNKKSATADKMTDVIISPHVSDIQMADKPSANNLAGDAISRKIIKEGDISFETNNIYATRNAIYNSLKKLGGYAAEENEANNSDNGRKEYTIKARIPAQNFDLFLNNVSAGAERIDTKNIRVKDVTTEYIDVSTQLANKRKLEDRYLELLKKGNKISDLLEIENKLSEIQTSIESTQGQLNYLEKQVEFGSLDITFYSRQVIKDNGQNFKYKLKAAFSDGWDGLGTIFFGFIGLWPLWVIIILLYLVIKRWRIKVRRRKANL